MHRKMTVLKLFRTHTRELPTVTKCIYYLEKRLQIEIKTTYQERKRLVHTK